MLCVCMYVYVCRRCCRQSIDSRQWIASVAVQRTLLRQRTCQSSVTWPAPTLAGSTARSTADDQPDLRLHLSTRQPHTPRYHSVSVSCQAAVPIGRITGLARPSVRPSACLSVSPNFGLLTRKLRKRGQPKLIWTFSGSGVTCVLILGSKPDRDPNPNHDLWSVLELVGVRVAPLWADGRIICRH